MPSPEEISRTEKPSQPVMHTGADALEFVRQKAGESLALPGHGHHRQEAVRDNFSHEPQVSRLTYFATPIGMVAGRLIERVDYTRTSPNAKP